MSVHDNPLEESTTGPSALIAGTGFELPQEWIDQGSNWRLQGLLAWDGGPRYPASMNVVRALSLLLLLLLPTVSSAAPGIAFAGGSWAAVDRGDACLALTLSQRIAPKDKVQATAGFAFTPDHRRWGEFHAHLSRVPRGGASVILNLGGQPFLLVSRGDWAWSRGPLQEQAIIAAARLAPSMIVESRDMSGRRFADPYLLDGAPTAIDAAAARCGLRGAGKIR